jgi:MATE family multidrug resistance protein
LKTAIGRRLADAAPAALRGELSHLRYVLDLALPSAGEQLLAMMVGLVDTFLVGHLGAPALAAVGLATQWVMMSNVFFSAVGTGGTALIARMIGACDPDSANRVLRQALLLAVLMGVITTVPGLLLAGPAVALMGAESDSLPLATTYLSIVSTSFLLASVTFVGNACLRGAGDTRTPLVIMAIVNVINIVVAWTLINGAFGLPRLGVAGSALGAMAARQAGGILVIAVLLRGRSQSKLALSLRGLHLDWGLVRRILRVGLPTGAEQLIFRFGMMSYARVVAALGTAAYAAHQVAVNAESLSYMPGFGFAVAATTLVGQGLGAKDKRRAERDGFVAFYVAAAIMSLMGVVFFASAGPIIGFFTSDPEVIALGVPPLRLIAIAQPFLASTMVLAGALRGAGETKAPMFVNGGSIWIVRVPLALLFTQVLGWGLTGAWIAMATDLGVRGALMFGLFRRGKWKDAEV